MVPSKESINRLLNKHFVIVSFFYSCKQSTLNINKACKQIIRSLPIVIIQLDLPGTVPAQGTATNNLNSLLPTIVNPMSFPHLFALSSGAFFRGFLQGFLRGFLQGLSHV